MTRVARNRKRRDITSFIVFLFHYVFHWYALNQSFVWNRKIDKPRLDQKENMSNTVAQPNNKIETIRYAINNLIHVSIFSSNHNVYIIWLVFIIGICQALENMSAEHDFTDYLSFCQLANPHFHLWYNMIPVIDLKCVCQSVKNFILTSCKLHSF